MKLEKTKDGSYTLYNAAMDEHYHSIHGALQESQHVFIKHGLALLENQNEITVFEMGFGTGLNALLCYDFAKKHNSIVRYITIEAFPLPTNIVDTLPYDSLIENTTLFKLLHHLSWNENHEIDPNFSFHKIYSKIEDLNFEKLPKANIVFYDAFAPSAQKHLWEVPILQKMYALLNSQGIFTTYCAQGQFKRNLKSVGFKVEALPGPPGKREMTIGRKLV